MKTLVCMLFFLQCHFNILNAQRDRQPAQPILVNKIPVSNRVNYSVLGKDSLRVELVNIDLPGLEIISCTNCNVDAPWTKLNGGELEVLVKNNGNEKSKPATVWVEYGVTKNVFTKFGMGPAFTSTVSSRKGVPALNPKETIALKFTIIFEMAEFQKSKGKTVIVSLSKNGERIVQQRSNLQTN